jgi:hypothetical protein
VERGCYQRTGGIYARSTLLSTARSVGLFSKGLWTDISWIKIDLLWASKEAARFVPRNTPKSGLGTNDSNLNAGCGPSGRHCELDSYASIAGATALRLEIICSLGPNVAATATLG